MSYEFELNSKIKSDEREISTNMETMKEDRKDQRVDRQAGHQMNMIQERKGGDSDKKFESSGNDIVTGGANLGRFDL